MADNKNPAELPPIDDSHPNPPEKGGTAGPFPPAKGAK